VGARTGSTGHPLPGIAVRIVDPETGAAQPLGEEGMLLVRGPNVASGYVGEPEASARAFRDGWFVTGDRAELDDDGFLTVYYG
jgi:acyl-[acyl-carrier-protein]-phospholipid O-acyltransferase/long-chain-fatty-acid--[acyl-carrier-protein] ligase